MKKEISEVISSLLYTHNCVIIPGFGGFVANHTPSYIQEDRSTIHPAGKRIAFNANLKENDGLVLNAITREWDISYKEAEIRMDQFVEEINSRLNQYRNLEFKNLGTFYLNPEEKLLFVPYYGQNFLDDSFGLPALKLKKITRVPGNRSRRPIHIHNKSLKRKSGRSNPEPFEKVAVKRRVLKTNRAALVLTVLFATLLGWLGLTFEPKSAVQPFAMDQSQQNPPKVQQEETASVIPNPGKIESLVAEEEIIDELYPPITSAAVELVVEGELLDEELQETVNTETEKDEPSLEEMLESYRNLSREQFVYHVVCMRTQSLQEAQRLKKQLIKKEYNAEILDQIKSGWYFVSAETLYNLESAEAFSEITARAERLKTEIIELSL